MDIQTSTQMTIKEAVKFYRKSDKTIRRWIKEGKVTASQIEGVWYVYPDEQDVVSPDVQPDVEQNMVEQMQSEITHLRGQVDQLTKLLAMATQEKHLMLERLPAPQEHPTGNGKRVFGFLDNLFKRA